jgi:Fic family protein
MAYIPQFTITPALLAEVEQMAALRERRQSAVVDLAWIPALQKAPRTRNVHASTAIEGNPLTLEQVHALEEGRELSAPGTRPKREVVNYFAGLRYVEKHAAKKIIWQTDILELHRILAGEVMDQGEAGKYRMMAVRIGQYLPPPPDAVSGLMFELLEWWNSPAKKLSPVLSSAILHYRFEAIHPFADGNGRTGRALALWELYRRGFDTHHIFSVDEYYWEDRPKYCAARRAGGGRRVERVAGILCSEASANPRAGVAADSNFPDPDGGETGLAPASGTTSPSAPRPREHGPRRNMGGAGCLPSERDGFVAPAA